MISSGCQPWYSASSSISFDENNVQDILNKIEEYSGQPYIEINNNTPTFKENEYTTKTYIQLNDLDEYGRTQKDQACFSGSFYSR